jgi:RecG-like helicase
MKKLILSLVFCALASVGFAQDNVEGQSFGEGVTKGNIIPATQVNAKLGEATKADMKVEGEVVTVCKKKGCFMTVKISDNETMFVKFKDYGFFMPKDMPAGTKVVIDGFAQRKETSVEDLKHYAEDAKKSPEEIAKITQPKKEIVFEAKGAVILK